MSGPTVVRVLTREERMAPSLKLLKTLRCAIARYETACEDRAGDQAQAEIQAIRARFEALAKEVQQANEFSACEDSLGAEIAFVQEKRESVQQAALEQRSQARLRQYSEQYQQAYLQEIIAKQQANYNRENSETALTEEQQTLLAEMQKNAGEPSASIAWEIKQAAIPEPVSRLERTMAALELLQPALAENFNQRLAALHAKAFDQKQDTAYNMARDTLYMELAETVKAQQEIQQIIEALEEMLTDAALQPAVISAIQNAIAARDLTSLKRLHAQIDTHLKAREAETFARLRREAVLQGLAELGYTPGETMETLVEKEGRIVLRTDSQADYGVELAGISSPRMQLRVLSFSDRLDPAADQQAEESWCTQVDALQKMAQKRGIEVTIEIAKKAGEVPVKKVVQPRTVHSYANQTKQRQSKA